MSSASSTSSNVQVLLLLFCFYRNMLSFLLWIEPIGLKPPSFSSLSKSFTYVVHQGVGFVLLCPAQALPVPMFRYCTHTNSNFVFYALNPSGLNRPLSQMMLQAHPIHAMLTKVLAYYVKLKPILYRFSGKFEAVSNVISMFRTSRFKTPYIFFGFKKFYI